MKNSIFISYRNSDGSYPAQLLAHKLSDRNYSIFLDKISLRAGKFPQQIKENILNCTDFIMVVTPDYFGDRIKNKNDWVRQEINLAIRHKKNIIPYLIGVDASSIKIEIKGFERVMENQALGHEQTPYYNSIDALISDYLHAEPNKQTFEDEIKNLSSIYDVTWKNEINRLKIQASRSKKNDEMILSKYLSRKHNLTVLDVGCAYGYTGQIIFNKDRYNMVLGIDKNKKCLRYAKANYANEKFVFENIDIESTLFENALLSAMNKYQIKEFDVIFISQVLHHLSNSLTVIRKLREVLKPGGLIFIREPDDGGKISTDPNLEKILNITKNISGVSDRYYGRKIFCELSKSGFKNINIYCFPQDTSSESFDEKILHFKEGFSFRINYAKQLFFKNPTEENRKLFNELELLLAKFEQNFYSSDFWYCGQSYIGVGIKD